MKDASEVKFNGPNVVHLDPFFNRSISEIEDETARRQLAQMAERRERYEAVHREAFRNKLDRMKDDAEAMQDYCRKLIQDGWDVTEELKELECAGHAMLLVALFLKREASEA